MGLPTWRYNARRADGAQHGIEERELLRHVARAERGDSPPQVRSARSAGLYANRPDPTAGAIVAHVHCGAREGSPAELGTATRSIAEIAPWALVRGSPVAFGRCVRAPLCRTADGLPRRGPSRGGAVASKGAMCVRHDSRGVYDFLRSHVQPQECAAVVSQRGCAWRRVRAEASEQRPAEGHAARQAVGDGRGQDAPRPGDAARGGRRRQGSTRCERAARLGSARLGSL